MMPMVALILTLLAAVSYATAKDLPAPAEASPLVRANNRFGLRCSDMELVLLQEGQQPCQVRSETQLFGHFDAVEVIDGGDSWVCPGGEG